MDQVERGYVGCSTVPNSTGNSFTADWIDAIGNPAAGLRSEIAEPRAKIVYERLIKQCDDAGACTLAS